MCSTFDLVKGLTYYKTFTDVIIAVTEQTWPFVTDSRFRPSLIFGDKAGMLRDYAPNLACTSYTGFEVAKSDKRYSLLRYGNNNGR